MEQPLGSLRDHAIVASTTPGRLRIRLHKPLRRRHLMRQVHAHLEHQEGVQTVESDAATGSVVVRYDPREQSPQDVLGLFRDVGIIVGDAMKGMGEDLPDDDDDDEQPAGHSHASRGLVDAFDDLDRRLSLATGHRIDLKLLFPLVLGVVGIRQLVRGGLGLSEIPAYIVLWYAFDAFHKLHQGHPQAPTTTPRATATSREPHSDAVSHDAS